MSEMDEKVLDEAMESSTEENASETKEDENVTSTEETAETAENADAEASEADSEDPDKKKSFFKKKKDKKDEQIEELTDKVKRQMAEFDNFRKRTEKEKSQMYDMGAKTIVEKILPVIDNFERGLAAVPEIFGLQLLCIWNPLVWKKRVIQNGSRENIRIPVSRHRRWQGIVWTFFRVPLISGMRRMSLRATAP